MVVATSPPPPATDKCRIHYHFLGKESYRTRDTAIMSKAPTTLKAAFHFEKTKGY